MTSGREDPTDRERCLSADEIVASQDVRPLDSIEDFAIDVWSSDAEVDAFIADVRRTRDADHA